MTSNDRRKIVKTLGLGIAGIAMGLGLATSAVAQENVTWRMQSLWDPGTTPQKFEEQFVKRVGELTNGRFKIDLFAAGQIVPAAQMFDAVRGGAFQLMKTFDGYEAGKIPAFAFTSTVPFGFPEPEQFEAWFYEGGGLQLAKEAYSPAGLIYIAPTVYGQEPIHSKVPISKIADLAGKKGRFVGLASAVMGAFGVSVTPLPTSEVYSALDKGVIDIADRGDLTANYEAGLAEVAKHVVLPGVHQPTTATSYVANRTAYERLPAEFKSALETAAKETSKALREHIREQDKTVLDKYREKGVTIHTLDPADIRENRAKAVEAWKAATKDNALAKKVLDSQMDYMKKQGVL
ncbi:TRAP transporter substrate-binding protein DctP [Microvirga roseola]|uniref:TRAP transporter substrate-binding protein DctP n=1 Tax=Microvirga roseola TaxID=2883126 RepID=UPI001E4C0BBB|nr:TRAP transporter substrate-binding protein DctP [Microvirga roseola]